MAEFLQARRERMLEVARQAGADVLVCYSSGVHSFMYMNAVWYASGVRSISTAAVVLGAGDPVLLVSPLFDGVRARSTAPDCDVRAVAAVVPALADLLRERASGTIALCGAELLPARDADDLERLLGRGWIDVGAEVDAACAVPDELETEAVLRATRIAEEGYRRALEIVKPGMREFELAGGLDHYMRELGADDNFLLMSASQHATSVNTPGDRIIEEGDLVLAEISPSVDGCFTQICRTAVVGTPSKQLIDAYGLLREAFAAGLAACKPGSALGTVVEAVNAPIAAAGFGEYCRPPYMRTRGHGMGLGSPKPQDLRLGGTEEIIEGMTFVLHPNQYVPTVGYLMCGDPVTVRPHGAEALVSKLADLDVVEV